MEFKESKTYQNLLAAYEGELKASGKYQIFAEQAREDGFLQIGDIFMVTSGNEKEHAQIWRQFLCEGKLPDTLKNLEEAYRGENHEWNSMYQEYAETAREEGYTEISKLFKKVAEIEKHHNFRFEQLANNILTNNVFCKARETVWICTNCGNLYHGLCAPDFCPVCGYPQSFYEQNCENY